MLIYEGTKVVYEEILDEARLSAKDGNKRVVIVKGGPGTGKSVVAVNLLAELTKEDRSGSESACRIDERGSVLSICIQKFCAKKCVSKKAKGQYKKKQCR